MFEVNSPPQDRQNEESQKYAFCYIPSPVFGEQVKHFPITKPSKERNTKHCCRAQKHVDQYTG
jgi:hypothetical protein